MTTQQLVCKYLQLRGELASAYAAEARRSSRLGHMSESLANWQLLSTRWKQPASTTSFTVPWSQGGWVTGP